MGAQRTIGARIWDAVKPPSGPAARRTVMAFTGVLAVGRLGLLNLLAPRSAARIDLLSQWEYGIVFAGLFVALLVTLDRRRMTMAGFAVSAVGAGAYAMMGIDVWPVITSTGYYLLMGAILAAEAAVIWRALHSRPGNSKAD